MGGKRGMRILSQKIREGSQIWVNRSTNPQKYSDTITARITEIIGYDVFKSKDYGIDTVIKVKYVSGEEKGTGYIEEVIQY